MLSTPRHGRITPRGRSSSVCSPPSGRWPARRRRMRRCCPPRPKTRWRRTSRSSCSSSSRSRSSSCSGWCTCCRRRSRTSGTIRSSRRSARCACCRSSFGGLLWPLAWLWAYTKPVGYKLAYGTDKHPDYFKEHGLPEPENAAADLRQRVAALEGRGVPASELDAIRTDLAALESRLAASDARSEVG